MTDDNLTVVVIDDDDIVPELVERSLSKVDGSISVVAAEDGVAGLELLRKLESEQCGQRQVILLDLNMPRMSGFEFLEELRADPALRDKIVFVLSTSKAELDCARAYRLGIAGYLVKSLLGHQLCHLTSLLRIYEQAILLPKSPALEKAA